MPPKRQGRSQASCVASINQEDRTGSDKSVESSPVARGKSSQPSLSEFMTKSIDASAATSIQESLKTITTRLEAFEKSKEIMKEKSTK